MKKNIYIFILLLITWLAHSPESAGYIIVSKQFLLNKKKLKEGFSDFKFKAKNDEIAKVISSFKKKKKAKCIKPLCYYPIDEYCSKLNQTNNQLIYSSRDCYFLHSFSTNEKRGPPSIFF